MKLDVLDLPFDQYQRYRLTSDLVNELRGKGERYTILDVGGRTGLLRAFLPKDKVSLVDLEASEIEGLVLGDGSRLPFKDKCFDIVATFDTLEHVPPARRADFVSECARVAKRWVYIVGPYQAPEVEEAEKILQRFLVDKLEVEHRYLEEHRHNGLPSLADTEKGLKKAGATVAHIGHGNLERWLALMCLSMYLDYEPRLRPLAARVFHFYNQNLYASDHALPVYRHAIVAAFAGAELPQGTKSLALPTAPRGVLDRFRDVADEVVSFDRARGDWREERARLAEILATLERDLAGHRASLEEERTRSREQAAVMLTLENDLRGHSKSLAEALAALETEREQGGRVRAELEEKLALQERQNAGLEGEAAKLLAELDGERERGERVRAELEADIARHRAAFTTVERDLEEHRALKVAHENELAQLSDALAALELDLKGHRATLAEERRQREEQVAVLKTLEDDLAGHRRSLADALAALETEREQGGLIRRELEQKLEHHRAQNTDLEQEAKKVLSELEAERQRGAAVRSELEADIARHRAAFHDVERQLEERRALASSQENELLQRAAVLAAIEADLDGHRKALAETRAIVEEQRAAIDDQRNVIDDQRGVIAALTEHRARVEEALADRDNQIAALTDIRAALETELGAHKRVLAVREADLEGHKKALAARETDLANHRRALKALEEDIARHRAEHERAVNEYQRRISDHRAVEAALTADLDGHRRLAVDLRGEVERARVEQARLQDELARARQEIDGKRGEIERAARALAENDALIGALRADLKDRWKSVKRGFGPKRATPGETA